MRCMIFPRLPSESAPSAMPPVGSRAKLKNNNKQRKLKRGII